MKRARLVFLSAAFLAVLNFQVSLYVIEVSCQVATLIIEHVISCDSRAFINSCITRFI